ncbi:MAG: hypothetical protein E7422_03960 [Ruminococcaceae bacterium]|nr:hypothetical protein [Oscillospiraceae bacterium]
MRSWQKWLLVLAVCTALLAAARYLGDPKRQMRNYVLQNKIELDAFAQDCLQQTPPVERTYDGRRVTVLEDYPDRVVVSWSAFGIVPASRYYELHYTADGAPHPAPGMENYVELTEMFGWCWVQHDGDNSCYVSHIDGNWYYVESRF